MTSADHVLRRWARAQAAAGAASFEQIQPPTWHTGALRWAKATGAWSDVSGHGSYVDCRPCDDAAATHTDTDILLRVYLPRAPGTDPNVITDQVIGYVAAVDGVYVATTGYLDDAIGTIKMWASDTADPPQGWTDCIAGGTGGRPSPTVEGLEGTFPVGKKSGDSEFGAVGDTGNLGAKTHCHTILRDAASAPCGQTTIDEGTWDSVDLSIQSTNHLPPWCVVRFIERYDNSA